jgi:DNA polymerase-3 subunit beta
MKISIDKSILVMALEITSKAAPSGRTSLAILEGILLEADDGKLNLTRNNLDIAVKHTAKCEVFENGKVIVNARLFTDIVKRLPDEEIDISTNGNLMEIKAGEARMEIKILPPDGYPAMPIVIGKTEFEIGQETLREMVDGVAFAVVQDDNRPVFQCVLIEAVDGTLNAVAIDGQQMAVRREQVQMPDAKILPRGEDLETVIRLFGKGLIKVSAGSNLIQLSTPETITIVRTVEGEFMNYRGALPNEFSTTIRVDKRELQQALERSLLFVAVENGRLSNPLIINIKCDKVNFSLQGDTGTFNESMAVETSGEDLRIGFNPIMLAGCLRHIEDKKVLMKFTTPSGPCVMVSVEGDKYTYMVLPVRV